MNDVDNIDSKSFGAMVRKLENKRILSCIQRAKERGDSISLTILQRIQSQSSILPDDVDFIHGYLSNTQAEEDRISKQVKKKKKKTK